MTPVGVPHGASPSGRPAAPDRASPKRGAARRRDDTPSRRQSSWPIVRRSLLLDLPIAWRLTLGFLLAALIAAAASGLSGIQRAQSLATQAAFYQRLLEANTSLTTGANFVQLMDT